MFYGHKCYFKLFSHTVRCRLKSVAPLLETMWDQLPDQHLLHSGEWVLWTLLLLWHERYAKVHYWWFDLSNMIWYSQSNFYVAYNRQEETVLLQLGPLASLHMTSLIPHMSACLITSISPQALIQYEGAAKAQCPVQQITSKRWTRLLQKTDTSMDPFLFLLVSSSRGLVHGLSAHPLVLSCKLVKCWLKVMV